MLSAASCFTFHASRLCLVGLLVLPLTVARAQVHGRTVGEDSGPVSDLSTNVGNGSGPVYRPGRSISAGSVGPLGGNSVRGSVSGNLSGGPVSDVTVGAVTSGRPMSGGGSVSDSSAGAVSKDTASAIRAPVAQPLEDLGPLRQQLRAVQPLLPDQPVAPEVDREATGSDTDSASPPDPEPAVPASEGDPDEQAADVASPSEQQAPTGQLPAAEADTAPELAPESAPAAEESDGAAQATPGVSKE